MRTPPVSKNDRDLVELYDATLKRLTVPYQTQFVDTTFGKTHIITAGSLDTEPVFLLHGSASNAIGCWPLINGLASKHRVVAPDAPRQLGKTEPFKLSSKNTDYGKWLAEVMDNLNIAHPSVVGFSFGGWQACKLASFAPERIDKIVLLSPIGVAPFRIQYWLQAPALFLVMLISQSEASIRRFANLISGPTTSEEIIEEMVIAAKVFLKNFYMQDMPYLLAGRNLKKLIMPILLLVGQFDPFCKPDNVISRLRRYAAKVQTEIIADSGHVIYFEKPEYVNARVLEFLDSDL